jgi:hypothetical protein
MEERNLESWAEFKKVVDDIREKYGYHEYTGGKEKNTVLFRGQQCAAWPLQTTLERKTNKPFSVEHYILRATQIVHELESYTDINWQIPDYPILGKEMAEMGNELFGPHLPCYDYLVYLRHHGYPSPLLDWSESPYVAAYFAMCDQFQSDSRVAIYAYIDTIDSMKASGGGSVIQVRGPNIRTHKRHFLQKAWYTTASKWSSEHKRHFFCSHHEIFDNPHPYHKQDILIKITLPTTERIAALRDLDDHNINHFTLFQTEDSLVKALSIREFDINND